MQRALSSRARASVLSNAASAKYRAGAGLSQQLRFAHKVSNPLTSFITFSILVAGSNALVS